MLMKPPARQAVAEAADIDVAVPVRLRQPEARKVQPAAIVEVELLVLVDDRAGIDRRPEVEPALRQAADDAGLGRQGHEIEQLLGGDTPPRLRHADAEIDHAAERQLERASPAITLRSSSGSGAMRSTGTRISPEKAGL